MNQVYWQGWIAERLETMAETLVLDMYIAYVITYPFLKPIELKYYGK